MGDDRLHLDRDELRRLLVDEERSFSWVARIMGVSRNTVANRARSEGIESVHGRRRRPELHDAEWLRDQFDAGRTIAEVADQLGVHYGSVVNARVALGVAPARTPKRPVDVEQVRRMLADGESLRSIGRALGHTSSAISKVVRRHGLA